MIRERKPGLSSLEYWAWRAEATMDDLQEQADRRLVTIGKALKEAQRNLSGEAQKIFRTYRNRFGLSKKEAEALLENPISAEEYDDLRARIISMPPGEAQTRLMEARLNSNAYAYRISQKEALRDNIAIELANVQKVYQDETTGQLRFVAAEAYGQRMFAIQQQVGRMFAVPDINGMMVALDTPWFGKSYSERIWGHVDDLAERLEHKIVAGFSGGKSWTRMSQELVEEFGVTFRDAEGLVRTESVHLAGIRDRHAYDDAEILHYRFLTALDSRTCKDCAPLDNKVFLVAEAVEGKNYPSMHTRCRCTTVAAVDGDVPMEGTRHARDAQGRSIQVPADMDYAGWRKWQEEQHGKERFDALQKMSQNKESDKEQYARYRKAMGKNEFTASLEAFQEMKYSNPEAYELVKLDYRRQNALIQDPSLRLPYADYATAANAKFKGYLFNPENSGGWAKGVAFDSRLGYNADNWEGLRKEILRGATRYPSTFRGEDQYGKSYEQKMVLYGGEGKPTNVVVGWKSQGKSTWLTTAIVKEVD